MLIKPWEGYFVEGLIEKKNGDFKIVEIDQNKSWSMTLNILTDDDSLFYQLFSKDQLEEKSRVNFCKMTNFPDAILLEKKICGDLIFHLIEFKKNPTNGDNIEKISKQLISGYMHTKLILPFIEPSLIEDVEVLHKYYVVYAHGNNGTRPSIGFQKVVPGTQIKNTSNNINRRRQLREWNNNRVVFRSLQPNSYTVFKKISKIQVIECESLPDVTTSYENTIKI